MWQWHQTGLPPLVSHVRCQGTNGPIPAAPQGLSLTRFGHGRPPSRSRSKSSSQLSEDTYQLVRVSGNRWEVKQAAENRSPPPPKLLDGAAKTQPQMLANWM
jgi:hypothetical protein